MIYYVYAYFDPDTHEILYVGKGKHQRAWAHLEEAEKNRGHSTNNHWHRKMKQIVTSGKLPIIVKLVEGLSASDALFIESGLIDVLGRRDYDEDGILYNVCKKANDWSGLKHREDTKQVIREKAIGRKRTQESIEKSRVANIGRKHGPRSESWQAKQRAAHLGKTDPNNPKRSAAHGGANNPRAKVWLLEREDGSTFEVKGLKPWCKEMGLSFDAICRRDGRWFDGVRLRSG
jgi:hypothetical protein